MRSMGGAAVFLDHTVSRLGERESIPDVARNLSRWVQGIVARVFEQRELELLAQYANIPVINALSDRFHPCQAYADFFTLEERFGNLRGLKLAYVGDGNNVCHSLMIDGRARGRGDSRGHAGGLRAAGGDRGRGAAARREDTGGKIELFRSRRRGGGGRASGLHRRLGQHGPGAGSRRARENIRAVSGQCCVDASRPRRTPCFCIACPRIAARKSPTR